MWFKCQYLMSTVTQIRLKLYNICIQYTCTFASKRLTAYSSGRYCLHHRYSTSHHNWCILAKRMVSQLYIVCDVMYWMCCDPTMIIRNYLLLCLDANVCVCDKLIPILYNSNAILVNNTKYWYFNNLMLYYIT
jgi:hypothetical protein